MSVFWWVVTIVVSIPASVALLSALLGLIDQFIDDTVADVDANRLQSESQYFSGRDQELAHHG